MVFDLLAALVFGGGIGGLLVLVGVGQLQNYRRTRRADPVGIRTLGDPSGSVEFEGTAEVHDETARAPLTDTECLLHEWKVEEYRGGGKGPNWSTLDSGDAAHPFLLDDGTGAVLVEPDGASIHLMESTEFVVENDESPPAPVEAYLRETEAVDSEHSRKRRYRESRLDPGGDVYVYGPVREAGHSADLPGGASAVVGVENPEERALEISSETSLSEVIDRLRGGGPDTDRFLLANTGESRAQKTILKTGLLALGIGLFFLSLPVIVVLT